LKPASALAQEFCLAAIEHLIPSPVDWLHAKFLDGKPDKSLDRNAIRWHMELIDGIRNEWSFGIYQTRSNLEVGVSLLPRLGRFGGPMPGKKPGASSGREFIPVLHGCGMVCSLVRVPVEDDAELLPRREGKRVIAEERHRIAIVQDEGIGQVQSWWKWETPDEAAVRNASHGRLNRFDVVAISRGGGAAWQEASVRSGE
jgi:hypothetical protein